jgi:threonyl-tRNA synthetase
MSVTVTLPDGSQRHYDSAVTVAQVAASIGAGLAKAALAARVDGRLVDTSHTIEDDVSLAIVTDRSEDALEVIRHSTAHLLAQAVKQLFPSAQVTIGPVIDDGFYYDFAFERPFTPDDLAAIEKRMEELAVADIPVERSVMPRDEAVAFFRGLGEDYKAEIIASIPSNEDISLYRQGDFVDLCRGPHVPSTGKLKAFRLTKLAGAYWRGDSRNEMLQRIYGTAWTDRKALTRTCIASRKPSDAIIGASARNCACSTPRKKRREWCSGIRAGGRCTRRWSSTCARSSRCAVTRKSARRRSSISVCGSVRATPTSSRKTCSR